MNAARAAVSVLLVLPALITAGCMEDETAIEGVVRDRETEEPIRGAEVEVSQADGPGRNTLTDGDGRYRIVVEPGTWNVEASAPGYEDAETDVVVEDGETAEQDFFLAQSNDA